MLSLDVEENVKVIISNDEDDQDKEKPGQDRSRVPWCNKDDATGACHASKAENPEKDPGQVFCDL